MLLNGKGKLNIDRLKTKIKNKKVILLCLCIILVLCAVLVTADFGEKGTEKSEKIEEGREYLAKLEKQDVSGIESRIRDTEFMNQYEQEDSSIWENFSDSVILGDSRAIGFEVFDFLPPEKVIAGGGFTIRNIPDAESTLKAVNPENVFLCYGLNDVSIGYWDTPEEYTEELMEKVRHLKKILPDTNIIVNSILPAKEVAFERSDKWRRIPEFNVYIKNACAAENIPYAECSAYAQANMGIYNSDGIHVAREFYPGWAEIMIETLYIYGL